MSTTINPTAPTIVTAELQYSDPPPGGKQAAYYRNDPNSYDRYDVDVIPVKQKVSIENVRGKEHLYSLDKSGFQFFNRPSKLKNSDFLDEKKIKEEYYDESAAIIKGITGASRVVFFDHTYRIRRPEQKIETPLTRQPAGKVHVDQSTKSSIARVHRHLPPNETSELLRHRFQILNIWRPITHPAIDTPLALCDYRSVDPKNDNIPVALIYPGYEGETIVVKYNPNHKWKYLRGMSPDEIVLIKCFDSIQDGSVAVYTPHTAFEDPTTPEGTPYRESIELRALVFYD